MLQSYTELFEQTFVIVFEAKMNLSLIKSPFMNLKLTLSTLFSAFVLVAFVTSAHAQTLTLKAGANFSNVSAKDDNLTYSDDYKANLGYTFGAAYDLAFSNILSLEPGILVQSKGFKLEQDFLGVTTKSKVNILYTDIPVNLKLKIGITEDVRLLVHAGPYVGFALAGNIKTTIGDDTDKTALDFGKDELNDDFKRMDFGVNFGAGVMYDQLSLSANYGYGLANISPIDANGYRANNRVLSLTLGYTLGADEYSN